MKYETIVCPFCGNGHAHITYEENRVYQMNCPDCHNAIFHRDTSWDNAVSFFKRMVVTDESAIRQQDHFREVTEKVEPLTLDELREMDGEPVWCEIYIKGQPSFYGIVHGETVTGFISGDDKPANLAITNVGAYGFAWLAYRQKPEEGTV